MQEFGAKWEMARAKNCLPGRKQYEKFNMTTYRNQETFTEFWDEGVFVPMDTFLESQGFNLDCFTDQASKLALLNVPRLHDAFSGQIVYNLIYTL